MMIVAMTESLPYTPCGLSCTSDGFTSGGSPGIWLGQVCPGKCAECQSDGILPPINSPGHLSSNHNCQVSPDQLYQQPTTKVSPKFAVIADNFAVDTLRMRDYVGEMHYAQIVLKKNSTTGLMQSTEVTIVIKDIHDPANYILKPRHFGITSKFDPSTNAIRFLIDHPIYLILQFNQSMDALMLFVENEPSEPNHKDPGVISLADFGVHPGGHNPRHGQGNAIQSIIDKLITDQRYHTLVFPADGGDGSKTYLTHDLHVTNSSTKTITLFFESGVLLQRDGSHIGELTSPGFFTIYNSTDVTLRGLGTFDALNGGQGLYISNSENVTVDGLIMRNTWWWNTEIEHSMNIKIFNYKIPNDPHKPSYQNDGLNIEHSTHVRVNRLFVASQDDLQCIKADPEDGIDRHGNYTPDIGEIYVSNMVGYNSGSISLKVGWGATCRRIFNISYTNIDIINNKRPGGDMYHGAVIGFDLEITHISHPVSISNISYTNVRYENQALFVKATGGFATIRNVYFNNITAEQGDFSSLTVVGNSSKYDIEGVLFKNVRVGGKLVTHDALNHGMKVAYAKNITFET